MSDHLQNFLIINNFSHLPRNAEVYRSYYSGFSQAALINDFQSLDWEDVLSNSNDPNLLFQSFFYKTFQIIDKHIPMKKVSKKELRFKSKPWITPGIQKSIKIKNNLYKKYIKSNLMYFFTKFKLYRNKINHFIKIGKKIQQLFLS